MIRRTFPFHAALRFIALALLGLWPLSVVHADYRGGSAFGHHPPTRAMAMWSVSSISTPRWRPQTTTNVRRAPAPESVRRQDVAPNFRGSDIQRQERSVARNAKPVTRGQAQGQRFRPDERGASPPPIEPPGATRNSERSAELQSQFRPPRPTQRRTYEEMQREGEFYMPYDAPPPQFPLLPGMPGYGGYAPPW